MSEWLDGMTAEDQRVFLSAVLEIPYMDDDGPTKDR